MSNEQPNSLAPRDPKYFQEMERIQDDYSALVNNPKTTDIARMVGTAKAIAKLRQFLTDELVKQLKVLENTKLGFMTDKKGPGYDLETLRTSAIEAFLRGLRLCGNEFNIIANNCYTTKEGFQGLMGRDERFQDVKFKFRIPQIDRTNKRAIVKYSATWKFQGRADAIEDDELPVKWHETTSDDAVLGKAERKARARIYSQATGNAVPEGDVESSIDVEGRVLDDGSDPDKSLRERMATAPKAEQKAPNDDELAKEAKSREFMEQMLGAEEAGLTPQEMREELAKVEGDLLPKHLMKCRDAVARASTKDGDRETASRSRSRTLDAVARAPTKDGDGGKLFD